MSTNPPVIFIHGFIGTLDVVDFDSEYSAPHLLGYGEYQNTSFEQISLPGQVAHIRSFIDARFGATTVDLVGHSVGGAIAMLFAHAYPERVRRIVNVEGNFTLADAFWSGSVGRMTPGEADAMLESFKADPLRWLSGAVVDPTPEMRSEASRWLEHQPASTLRAMGRSVVTVTGSEGYLPLLQQVFERRPVYLLSGQRSRDSWNIPDWALEKCAGHESIDQCGHLMGIENPSAFSASLRRFLSTPDARSMV
jgi:pimeloyl-ACP methyl ester carboxylesterase